MRPVDALVSPSPAWPWLLPRPRSPGLRPGHPSQNRQQLLLLLDRAWKGAHHAGLFGEPITDQQERPACGVCGEHGLCGRLCSGVPGDRLLGARITLEERLVDANATAILLLTGLIPHGLRNLLRIDSLLHQFGHAIPVLIHPDFPAGWHSRLMGMGVTETLGGSNGAIEQLSEIAVM